MVDREFTLDPNKRYQLSHPGGRQKGGEPMQGTTNRAVEQPTRGGYEGHVQRSRGLVVDVGLLGLLVWEYMGTNAASRHRQAETVEAIRDGWGQAGPGMLRVPRFGASYEMLVLVGFDSATLARGVGWYTGVAASGEVRSMVLAGHRVTRGEPFAHLAEVGDRVVVESRTHVFVYELVDHGRQVAVAFTTSWPLWPLPDPAAEGVEATQAMVTLVTCTEVFHTDKRRVVRGVLVSAETK